MKSLVVIVPGSFIKTPPFLSPLARIYCWFFGISLSSDHTLDHLQAYISSKTNYDTKQFTWSGKVSNNLSSHADELINFLRKEKSYDNIVIIGKSLGGNIVEIASKNANFPKNVSKIIFLATPHDKDYVTKSKIKKYNIYSPADNYVSFAKIILFWNFSSNRISNAENIIIPFLRHSDFNTNKGVLLNNRTIQLYEFYVQIVTNNFSPEKV